MGGLVKEDDVILSTLHSVEVGILGTVLKVDGAAVAEFQYLILVIVSRYTDEFGTQDIDVVVDEFRVGSTDNEYLNTGITQSQQFCLGSYAPRLTASTG
jgi:hypothetical protein